MIATLLLCCLVAAPPQTQSENICSVCTTYAAQIEEAMRRGDIHFLRLLADELARTDLSREQQAHLAQCIRELSSTVPESPGLRIKSGAMETGASVSVADKLAFAAIELTSQVGRNDPASAFNSSAELEEADDNDDLAAEPNAFVRPEHSGPKLETDAWKDPSGDTFSRTEPQDTGDSLDQQIDFEAMYKAAGYSADASSVSEHPDGDTAQPQANSNSKFALPPQAAQLFSKQYLRIRDRYLNGFFYEGLSATALNLNEQADPSQFDPAHVESVDFADQTLHMGQALLAFAGESAVLDKAGLDSSASEAVITRILAAFQELDDADGLPEIYGSSKDGFFLRDLVHDGLRRGVPDGWKIKSDSQSLIDGGPKHQPAMSIDQTASLFVGWWAVARYSNSASNRNIAQAQCDRVINFLRDSLFFIKLPNGDHIPTHRGPEFRYAAGFMCRMAEATTGKSYFDSSSIDITIKGDPIRFRDDNLGEFEIPGFTIPATVRVGITHPLIVALTPAAVAVMTTPRIKIPFSDLFPGNTTDINLPCAHMVQAHPGGHDNTIPCVHLTVAHPDGDLVGTLPCAHMVQVHPDGDKVPCAHMTAKHPSGHDVTLPCLHIGKLHGSHKKKVGGITVKVPCTHIGPKHSGGHKQNTPCLHLKPKHDGHMVSCVHLTAEHPAGHKQYVPCVHPTALHPGGDTINLPCAHFEQAHPSGHGFDLRSLDIDIPLGDKMHPYTRHIVLQCFAFEPSISGVAEFVPAAQSSNHVWSLLLRNLVCGDIPVGSIAPLAKAAIADMPEARGPDNRNSKPWARSNRWERCTDLDPSGDGIEVYNGLDYLSLEVLARLNDIN